MKDKIRALLYKAMYEKVCFIDNENFTISADTVEALAEFLIENGVTVPETNFDDVNKQLSFMPDLIMKIMQRNSFVHEVYMK